MKRVKRLTYCQQVGLPQQRRIAVYTTYSLYDIDPMELASSYGKFPLLKKLLKIWIKVVFSWLPKKRRFPIYQSYLRLASRTCTQVRPWGDRIKSIPCGIFSKSQICAIFLKDLVNILQYFWKGKCWDEEATSDLHISILQNMDQNKRDIWYFPNHLLIEYPSVKGILTKASDSNRNLVNKEYQFSLG